MFECTLNKVEIYRATTYEHAKKISSLVDCGQPVAPQRGSLETYTNTTEGSEVFYSCNPGLVAEGRMRAVCTDNGWNSNPADLICTEGMLGDCQHPLLAVSLTITKQGQEDG